MRKGVKDFWSDFKLNGNFKKSIQLGMIPYEGNRAVQSINKNALNGPLTKGNVALL